MKTFIGGLFKNRADAEKARDALQGNGFDEAFIDLLQYTYQREPEGTTETPSFSSIGRGALMGALILGTIGGTLGLLVGLGVIQLPSLEPSASQALPFQITWQFVLASVSAGLILGGVTGIILGAASRLFIATEKKEKTPPGTRKGDLMLAVQAEEDSQKSKARHTMKEHGAVKFEEFRENWDAKVWSLID